MKKIILLLALLLLISGSAMAQITVPQAVKSAFEAKFPNAENVKWDKENRSEYEANFTLGVTEMSASFLRDGTWLETETTIAVDQLPQAVQDAVKQNYSTGTITGASKIEKADNSIVYETDIRIKSKTKEVIFDEKGNIVK
jgi:hypothetical protein